MKDKIKKIILKIKKNIDQYPISLIMLYGYMLFILFITLFLDFSVIILAYAPWVHLERINKVEINLILFILLVISVWRAISFRKNAKDLQDWIVDIVVKLNEQLPFWIIRLLFLILLLGAILGLNQVIKETSSHTFNIIIQKAINYFSKWSSIVTGIGTIIFQLLIFNISDLKVAFIYQHKLITNYKLKNIKNHSLLTIIATNKGNIKASYKLLGICTEAEKSSLYKGELQSILIQPKAYYQERNKNIPLKMKTISLDKNDSCIYLLQFDEIPKSDFFIVFLEMPNKLIFVPVYTEDKNIQHHFLKNFIYLGILVAVLMVANCFKSNALKKIYNTQIKTEIINNKHYQIVQSKNYSKANSYSIFYTTVKLKKYQILKLPKANNDYKCLIELSANKKADLYFNNCWIITKDGRKFNVKIESYNENYVGKNKLYQIITRQLDLADFRDIKEVKLSCFSPIKHKKEFLNLLVD